MNIDQACELESVQMELFFNARDYRNEGNLKKYIFCLAVTKYVNKYLNGFYSNENLPNPVYEMMMEKVIEDGELSVDEVNELDRYGRQKAEFLIMLLENPLEALTTAKMNAEELKEKIKYERKYFSPN